MANGQLGMDMEKIWESGLIRNTIAKSDEAFVMRIHSFSHKSNVHMYDNDVYTCVRISIVTLPKPVGLLKQTTYYRITSKLLRERICSNIG